MTKFVQNNAKNASIGYISFELNYNYYFHVSYKKDINPKSKSKLVGKLLAELTELMLVYHEKFHYMQKLQKRAYDKIVKFKSYTPGNNIQLNSKYIKTK